MATVTAKTKIDETKLAACKKVQAELVRNSFGWKYFKDNHPQHLSKSKKLVSAVNDPAKCLTWVSLDALAELGELVGIDIGITATKRRKAK